jgi:arsenite methyltransferase
VAFLNLQSSHHLSTWQDLPLRPPPVTPKQRTFRISGGVTADTTRSRVQQYYGKELQTSDDLQTNACCTGASPPAYIQDCIKNLHPVTVSKYYGCGLCLPSYNLSGAAILDLGCGAGRDVYVASQLAGPDGKVVGVDMTPEQLQTAREYEQYHSDKFGFSNTSFYQGYLETLADIKELQPGTFDLIISNCVINLCTDKKAVLKACYELLKPGGEIYFSDVYSNRRVPKVLRDDPVLYGECLSGALYWNDFANLAKNVGFLDPRLVEDAPVTIANDKVRQTISGAGCGFFEFYSATYRLMKLDGALLEPACEDYGQAVIYKGTIPNGAESGWMLDKHHVFEAGKIHPVCGNTYNMLYHNVRVRDHFEFIGSFEKHYGIFEGCGSTMPYQYSDDAVVSGMKKQGGSSGGSGCC